ncbi:DUF2202 domain-containing protein [Candidatus Woesearchaeota archaeon]|nr:DUF2202 domain-containing protein [Candidatus Woesearchaeota archaeon]
MKKSRYVLVLCFLFALVACSTTSVPSLTDSEFQALKLTLEDEYKAEATYQKVLDTFGNVRPFSNIIRAEQTHSEALIVLFEQFGIEVPVNEWYENVPAFLSIQGACQEGVQAEIANVALYDRLLVDVQNDDIRAVFERLRDASKNNHLPAFERCARQ